MFFFPFLQSRKSQWTRGGLTSRGQILRLFAKTKPRYLQRGFRAKQTGLRPATHGAKPMRAYLPFPLSHKPQWAHGEQRTRGCRTLPFTHTNP